MHSRSIKYTSTTDGLSASSPSRSTRQAALEETRRECEKKRSEIEINTANLLPHKSDVPLKAAPFKGAGTTAPAEALQNKAAMNELNDKYEPEIKKLKNDLEEVDDDMEEVEENMEEVESRIVETRKILIAAQAEFSLETAHHTVQPVLEAFQEGKITTAVVYPDHPEARPMQQLTGSTLSKGDFKQASQKLQNRPSKTDGALAYYNFGTEMIENKRGVKVHKNPSIVKTKQWEIMEKDERGLPNYLAEKSHNLLTGIPENSILLPRILGCGVGYFIIAEEPATWNKNKSLVDLVADLFAFSDWREMHQSIGNHDSELRGMSSKRFIGNDIVPFTTNMPAFCKKAGYVFTFDDGNSTRFDTSGQMLGLPLPAMETPSKEEFLRKHGADVFSVEKVGDENYGIKRFRIYKDVWLEIGPRFKKGREMVPLKVGHMPKVVEVAKPFETTKGKFMVTRLILD